jgi:hypothetical protein
MVQVLQARPALDEYPNVDAGCRGHATLGALSVVEVQQRDQIGLSGRRTLREMPDGHGV